MNKKPFLSKHPKRILFFLLACLITITLAGCDRSNRKPVGGLGDLDATYATTANGQYSVTVGQVYDKLRYNADTYIEEKANEFIFSAEINTVKADLSKADSKYKSKLDEKILKEIYGTSDAEEIAELKDSDKMKYVSTYIDNMFEKGYTITKGQIEAAQPDFTSVYPYYYLDMAKHVAAENKLATNFTMENGSVKISASDITTESYFTKEEVASYYKNNYTNEGDVTALLIRFINSEEAENIFKQFGLKRSGGKLYQIKFPEGTDANNPLANTAWADKVAYDKYYNDYKLNLTGETGIEPINEMGNGEATVLKVMIEIYNYIYTYRAKENPNNPDATKEAIDLNTGEKGNVDAFSKYGHLNYYFYIKSIIDADRELRLNNPEKAAKEYDTLVNTLKDLDAQIKLDKDDENVETFIMSKEKLNNYSSYVANYLYNTLDNKEYTANAVSLGSYNYLFFKIHQVEDKKLYDEKETTDGTDYDFSVADPAFLNEVVNAMFEDEITETYIKTVVDERIAGVSLKIYDSLVETKFMTSTSALAQSYTKTNKKNNDLLAEVKYQENTYEIKVVDAYAELDKLYGAQIASNLLFQEYIKSTNYYTDLEGEFDTYVESVKTMLTYFSNNYYATNGYPSSIGKYSFMMLYFGTADIENAVRDYLMVTDATNAYFGDFASRGFEGDEFYEKLLGWHTELNIKDFYSITVNGLSVFMDEDEDNVADVLDEDLKVEAAELLEIAYEEASKKNSSYDAALKAVVAEYNKSSRIPNDNPTSPESKWAKYRALGLNLEVTSFGTFSQNSDEINEVFEEKDKELIIEEYNNLTDKKLGFTSQKFDDTVIYTKDNKVTNLLFTSSSLPISAKYETENEDELKIYSTVKVVINDKQVVVNLDYSSDNITEEQIKVYVAEYVLLGDVYSLPSTTITALDTYILPLISKYTGTAGQLTIVQNVLGGIDFANDAQETFYKGYIKLLQNRESDYDETYNSWWSEMYKGGSN